MGLKLDMSGPKNLSTGLGPAPSSGNSMYDGLFDANPYRNLNYKQSGWQTFLSGLGFRTDADRWREEAQVNANEYDAQVASIMQQNEYNDPASQAARMRAAGQNPDLLGTNGVAESASPQQDVNGMSPNLGDEFGQAFEKVSNFASGIMSMFQIGMGFAKDLMSFRQMQNAVDRQDVQMLDEFRKYANDIVLDNSPAVPFPSQDEYDEHILGLQSTMRNIPKLLGWNRRQSRAWYSVTGRNFYNSREFKELTGDWYASSNNADKYSKIKQNFYTADDGKDQWKAFNILTMDLGDLANSVWKSQQHDIKSTAEFHKELQDSLDAGMIAKAQNDEAGLTSQSASVEKKINSTMERIVNDLERQANDGDLLASGLLLAMQIFRMSNFSFGSKVASFGLKGF